MVIHYKDILNGESECGNMGRLAIDISLTTCMDCLESVKKEWKRQVKEFTGQPKLNAVLGLKRTINRIKELKD